MKTNKKILYVTTIGSTMNFFKSLIKELIDKGYTVDIATNTKIKPVDDYYKELGCKIFDVDFTRDPKQIWKVKKGIGQIRRIVDKGEYDIVHCHTPVAAMCTRFACRKFRKTRNLKVIYTAHGFHFYTGAPKKNWLLYYPVEWLCSFMTDTLITINKEDFNRAKKHFHAKKIEYVPGVGIDIDKFTNCKVDVNEKRKELGIPNDAFLILSVGELNANKNHEVVIKALSKMNNSKIFYIIAGNGPLDIYLSKLIKSLNLSANVKLLGRRTDIAELCKASDMYIHPSKREGLGVAIMEAISCSLPCICSDIHGPRDLITNQKYLFGIKDYNKIINLIQFFILHSDNNYVHDNLNMLNNFSVTKVNPIMLKIYKDIQ